MKAIVLGATGHIGNAVVRELLARGYEVTAASRRKTRSPNLDGLPVRFAPAETDFPEQFDRWLAGHALVVDASAPYPLQLFQAAGDSEGDAVSRAEERTRALLGSVARQGLSLAYVSSFTTLLQVRGPVERWGSRLMQRLHPYFAVKKLIESEVLAAASRGMPATVVNPTMCVGPWDLRPRELCFIPLLASGEPVAAAQYLLNVIDVRDVAAGLVSAVEARAYGQPILLSGHNISTESLYSWIAELGGVESPRFYAPATLSLIASYGTELALGLTGRPTPLPSLFAMLASMQSWTVPGGAQLHLGVAPRPLSQTLLDAIHWYRSIGYC